MKNRKRIGIMIVGCLALLGVIAVSMYMRMPEPPVESYALFRTSSDGNKEYVKLINGIMTVDHYIESPEQEVLIRLNSIDLDTFQNSEVARFRSKEVRTFEEYSPASFDTYAILDGEIRLLRFENMEADHGAYKTLDIVVTDLMSKEPVDYKEVLDQNTIGMYHRTVSLVGENAEWKAFLALNPSTADLLFMVRTDTFDWPEEVQMRLIHREEIVYETGTYERDPEGSYRIKFDVNDAFPDIYNMLAAENGFEDVSLELVYGDVISRMDLELEQSES